MVIDKAAAASDAPPAYVGPEGASSSSTPAGPSKAPLSPPPIAQCNTLNIERPHNKIEGVFVVAPDLVMAEELLAPLSERETEEGRRANLRLSSAHGSIKVDVWVLDSSTVKQPTWLSFHAPHSTSNLRIHSTGTTPCKIDITATHATTKLQLPLDWQGMIIVKRKHGNVSPLPTHNVTTISEVDGVMRCFVGDISLLGGNPWQGNSLDVTVTHGSLKLRFGPEVVPEGTGSKLTKDNKNGRKWSWWPSAKD